MRVGLAGIVGMGQGLEAALLNARLDPEEKKTLPIHNGWFGVRLTPTIAKDGQP